MESIPDKLKISDSALIQSVSDEMVILDIDSGQYYTLNDMATVMVTHLKQGISVSEIVSRICEEYEVTQHEVEEDLAKLIKTLLEKQLVTPA